MSGGSPLETIDNDETGSVDAGEKAVDVDTEEVGGVEAALALKGALYPSAPAESAAAFGFELKIPAVMSPSGHPSPPAAAHASLLQHHMMGGVVAAQVYH